MKIYPVLRKGAKESCIDNIYSNSDVIRNSGTLDWNFSDHQAVFVNRKKTFEKLSKKKFKGRSYKNYNKETFQDILRNFSWNEFFIEEDPDVCWSIFINRIINSLEEMCPEKEFKIFEYKESWMNRDIMELIIDKDKALKLAKKSKKEGDWNYAK